MTCPTSTSATSSRTVVLAGPPSAPAVPMCTILRAPDGGWTAVLHPSDLAAPEPSPHSVTFPDVPSATRYARARYGTLHVAVVVDAGTNRRPA